MVALTDFAELRGDARRLWTWWIDELSACVPASLRKRISWRPRTEIRLGRDGIDILCIDGQEERRFREGQPLARLDGQGWEELSAFVVDRATRLILAPRDVHCFTLDLPRRSGRNLPSAIALQLDFASPVEPSRTIWSWSLLHADRNRVEVQIAQAKAALIDEIDRLFAMHGVPCPPVYAETPAGSIRLREGEVFRSAEGQRNRRAIIASLAILGALPVLLLAGAHFLSARNEARLDMVRREIAPKVDADRWARREAKLWQAWATLDRFLPASVVLGDLGQRAPEGASIETIAVSDGGEISFALAGRTSEDAIESLATSNGLLLISGPTTQANGADPVSMTAEMP